MGATTHASDSKASRICCPKVILRAILLKPALLGRFANEPLVIRLSMMSLRVSEERIIGGVPAGLKCPVCLEVLNQPYIAICQHVCCKDCWENVLESDMQDRCPICRDHTSVEELVPSRRDADWLESLTVTCEFKCGWQGRISEHRSHVERCPIKAAHRAEEALRDATMLNAVLRTDLDATRTLNLARQATIHEQRKELRQCRDMLRVKTVCAAQYREELRCIRAAHASLVRERDALHAALTQSENGQAPTDADRCEHEQFATRLAVLLSRVNSDSETGTEDDTASSTRPTVDRSRSRGIDRSRKRPCR